MLIIAGGILCALVILAMLPTLGNIGKILLGILLAVGTVALTITHWRGVLITVAVLLVVIGIPALMIGRQAVRRDEEIDAEHKTPPRA